jgi:hypothetical protein
MLIIVLTQSVQRIQREGFVPFKIIILNDIYTILYTQYPLYIAIC